MDGLTEEEAAIVSLVSEFVDRGVKPVARYLEHGHPGGLTGGPAGMTEVMERTETLLPGPAQALGALLGVPVPDLDATETHTSTTGSPHRCSTTRAWSSGPSATRTRR